jgi:enterochelin esterase-like enzyme
MDLASGVLVLLAAAAASTFADLQASLALGPADGDGQVRRFIESAGGTPLVEGSDAVFLAEGDPGAPPRVIGDFNGWGEGPESANSSRMERLASTRFFLRRVPLLPAARVQYLLVAGEKEAPDPLNLRRVAGFSGPQSEVRMPGYEPVVEEREDPSVPRGKVVSFEHQSAIRANARRVHVYLPPGYDPGGTRRYPEAWLGDGTTYAEGLGVPRLIDRLIAAGRLEPIVAIFVDPKERREEYDLHDGYRRMMVSELVPRIASEYRVEGRATRRLLAGGSRGGLAALDLCLESPETFGLCGAWAPAIAPRSVHAFLDERAAAGLFILVRALYDDRFGPDAPALRDGLSALGASVRYLEAPQGHSLAAWPDLTARVLLEAFPARR